MNKVLLDIRARAFALSSIEMLFHTSIASFLPLIILVVESVLGHFVLGLALITHRVYLVVIIL